MFKAFALIAFCGAGAFGQTQAEDSLAGKRGTIILPALFYSPETKFGGGVVGGFVYRPPQTQTRNRASSLFAAIILTQRRQFSLSLFPDFYWPRERYRFFGELTLSKYPDKFYGLGNNTAKEAEEDYTPRTLRVIANLYHQARPGWYVGARYDFERNRIAQFESGGVLAQKLLPGSASGQASGLGLVLYGDTRDSNFYPRTGGIMQLNASWFGRSLGGDYAFSRYSLDLRRYVRVAKTHVLALQGYMNAETGAPPLQLLALFGGEKLMRGYYRGRYRERNLIATQAEYRMPLVGRLGAVVFAGYGDVAHKLRDFELRRFKHSLGLGARFLFSRSDQLNLRVDFGFGADGSSGVYINVGEAF